MTVDPTVRIATDATQRTGPGSLLDYDSAGSPVELPRPPSAAPTHRWRWWLRDKLDPEGPSSADLGMTDDASRFAVRSDRDDLGTEPVVEAGPGLSG